MMIITRLQTLHQEHKKTFEMLFFWKGTKKHWKHLLLIMVLISTPKALAKPLTQEKSEPPKEDSFTYHAAGKRDPFQPPVAWLARAFPDQTGVLDQSTDIKPKKAVRKKEFLETFQLDSMKLVAILHKIGGQPPVAMVEDPAGKGHLIRRGNYIGVNEGRVTRILDGKVIIVEPLPRRHETKSNRTITLQLHKQEKQGGGNAQTGKH